MSIIHFFFSGLAISLSLPVASIHSFFLTYFRHLLIHKRHATRCLILKRSIHLKNKKKRKKNSKNIFDHLFFCSDGSCSFLPCLVQFIFFFCGARDDDGGIFSMRTHTHKPMMWLISHSECLICSYIRGCLFVSAHPSCGRLVAQCNTQICRLELFCYVIFFVVADVEGNAANERSILKNYRLNVLCKFVSILFAST